MTSVTALRQQLETKCTDLLTTIRISKDNVIAEARPCDIKAVCLLLRDDPLLKFECLMDVAGVDYSRYGCSEWDTNTVSTTGFSRGVTAAAPNTAERRFAVVYQLLSVTHNQRMTLKIFPEGEPPVVDSVVDIWPSANWNEREVFDLFGILFRNHPDCRRILTDYGFIGHPFRKDFPLSGHVEVRYDAGKRRVVYDPVDIQPRVLVPKVIRSDASAATPPSLAQESTND